MIAGVSSNAAEQAVTPDAGPHSLRSLGPPQVNGGVSRIKAKKGATRQRQAGQHSKEDANEAIALLDRVDRRNGDPAARGARPRPARKLVSESYHIPARDPGIQLFVRNKRPEAMTTFTPDRILLFVHGATYPAETAFDLQLDGLSWMDYIAQRGYDVYLMDVRGYGRSTRPPEMALPAKDNRPIVHTDVAVKDFGTVVDHILARRGVAKINLMAWSWGTVIAGTYAAQNNDKVERLVLYAPVWLRQGPSLVRVEGPLGAYRTVTMETARQRWLTGVAADKQKDLIPSGWFEAWWKANLEADPDRRRARSAGSAGTERSRRGRPAVLGRGHSVLRRLEDPGAGAAGARGVGRRHTSLHGSGPIRTADRRARQAIRGHRRGDAHGHHGTEPDAPVPRGPVVFGRGAIGPSNNGIERPRLTVGDLAQRCGRAAHADVRR